jgi:hypothetical protein
MMRKCVFDILCYIVMDRENGPFQFTFIPKISACRVRIWSLFSSERSERVTNFIFCRAGWFFQHQSYSHSDDMLIILISNIKNAQMCIWYIMLYCNGQGKWPFPVYFYLFKLLEFKSWINLTSGHFFYHYYC